MSYQNKFWEDYFKYYDILLKVIPYQELMNEIVKSIDFMGGHRILDLGAGTGNLQYFLPNNIDIVSLDNSEYALARLKQKFPSSVTIKHSILKALPFEDNTFDRVVSNNVLYTLCINEWDPVVAEIARVTKPNGVIITSNLNENFKAINIYKDHIKKSIFKRGYIKTMVHLAKLIYPTYKMMQFNRVINSNNENGAYSFLKSDKQRKVFVKNGLKPNGKTKNVYSNQAYMDVFTNYKFQTIGNQ